MEDEEEEGKEARSGCAVSHLELEGGSHTKTPRALGSAHID
jgi:hypothetical protein